jgi:hypothetical protein
MSNCPCCGSVMLEDDGYETIGRCKNPNCQFCNRPESIKGGKQNANN